MKNNNIKKMGMVILLCYISLISVIPSINAETISLDGIISETVWSEWFDDSGFVSYKAYYTTDEDAIYVGLVIDYSEIDEDANVRFAFRGKNCDFSIKITPDGNFSFKPGSSSRTPWWGSRRSGLPTGVTIVESKTEDIISYEIKILKEILGDNTEIPDNFPIWVMINEVNGVRWSAYPDKKTDWWFYTEDKSDIKELDEIPMFHAPEFPLGTFSSIVVMAGALLLVSRKNVPAPF